MPREIPGSPYPFGASRQRLGVNFAVFSKYATAVTLRLFKTNETAPSYEISLDPRIHRTGSVWHICLSEIDDFAGYCYRVAGPNTDLTKGAFDPTCDLLDPYAKGVIPRRLAPLDLYSPIGLLPREDNFDWTGDSLPATPLTDLVIYEMHVGGFTRDPSSGVKYPGTYLGVIEKIPHLKNLGINAVELLPIFEFDPREAERSCIATKETLGNYWGYSTVNFFTPATCYAASSEIGASMTEFRQMVKALHQAGIEVILDVVYNHTAEGDHRGPTLSFRGFDNASYYILDGQGRYQNFTGCGNTFNCNHPVAREFIIQSLRYWIVDMHVDGFRFDLASILTRDRFGHCLGLAPILEAIADDPIISGVKLIAEPWDAAGLYQVGSFCPVGRRWSEWNGRYRDAVRRFIKGDEHANGEFATRLCGSEDLYGDSGTPKNSINFITAHDGFTLADLVSYNHKHNEANGEGDRDGSDANYSWNCGAEGATDDAAIKQLRERQMRNLLVALIVSRGIPMVFMGDEYGHTKEGNNNTWCLNDRRNWLQWDQLQINEPLFHFFKHLIALRRGHPMLRRDAFYTRLNVEWHGVRPHQAEWGQGKALIAVTLRDHTRGDHLYVAFNATSQPQEFFLPELPHGVRWACLVNTAAAPFCDLFEDRTKLVDGPTILLQDYSAIILKGE